MDDFDDKSTEGLEESTEGSEESGVIDVEPNDLVVIDDGVSLIEQVVTDGEDNSDSLCENLVTKSNALIQASYKLTLQEQRLILAAISKIDSRKMNHYPGKPIQANVHVSAIEFAETFGLSTKKAYEELKGATENIFERKITEIDGKKTTKFRWVSKVAYHDGEGWAELLFANDVIPHLTFLREKFTSYKLHRVAGLRSTYSFRLFEFFMQFQSTGILRISLIDFIEKLDIPYTRFADIKRRVIEPAIFEIKSKSGLYIEWKTYTQGRKVVTLEFTFSETAQRKLDM